jgi:D-3-phosphoglycerate dehydrogenase
MNVLISTSSFGRYSREPLDLLEAWGASCRLNAQGRKLTEAEIGAMLEDVDGLIAGTEPLTRQVMSRAPRLKVISRCGTGIDNVDLAAAAELGITVRNTPDVHVDAVAELSLAAMLAALRHLVTADREIRAGGWRKPMGRLLRGKTVGLVGTGRVGRRLVELLEPFHVEMLACDPNEDREFARSRRVRYLPLDDLLSRSDVISLHLPMTEETRHLIGRDRIERMQPGAVLINCARGGLVDEDALAEGLQEGRPGAAFIDTFEREPYDGPLKDLENVVLSPHIGSYAVECRTRMELESVRNLIHGFEDGGNS